MEVQGFFDIGILVIAHDSTCAVFGGQEHCEPEVNLLTVGPETDESSIPFPKHQLKMIASPPESPSACAILEALGLIGIKR